MYTTDMDPSSKQEMTSNEDEKGCPVVGHASLEEVYDEEKGKISKQTTFLERGFALCPPEGGTPSGPS